MVINPLFNDISYAAETKLIDLVEEASITSKRRKREDKFNQASEIYYLLHSLTYDDYIEVEQINNILERLKTAANLYAVPVAPLVNQLDPPTVNVGPQGPKGDKGDTGDTGPQGIQGIQGEPGADGAGVSLTEGKIYIGDSNGDPVEQTVTGDISLTSGGVASINAGVIVNADVSASAGIALTKLATSTASRATVFNSGGYLEASSVTSTELGYLSGVSSAIQTQLNTKQATISGAASTVASADLAASRVVISGTSGKIEVSEITSTELGYIAGITSSIQTQLDAKLTTDVSAVTEGDVLFYDGTAWINLSVGSSGQVLTVSSGVPTWQDGTSNGLPSGGTATQYLIKDSGTDYDASWADLTVSSISDLSATADDINLLIGLDGTITNTELTYLAGTTSSIQDQLDAKQGSNLAYNALWVGDGSNIATQLAPGSTGQVLTSVGGVPQWQTPSPPGDVTGPVSATDNAIVRFNTVSGDAIQNSGVIIDDSDNITGVVSLQIENQGLLKLEELGGANYVALRASSAMSADYTITLPAAAPASNTFLKYDGADYIWAAGSGGGSALQQKEESGTTYSVVDGDDGYIIYFTNVAGCTVTLSNTVSTDIEVTTVRADGAGLITHAAGGSAVRFTIDDEYDIEHEKGAATWVKKNSTDWYGWGSLGPSGGGGGGGTFATITGDPYDNTALGDELNLKSNALTTVDSTHSGSYTLAASELTAINTGTTLVIEGDTTGDLTVPANATVAFPVGTNISVRDFDNIIAAGSVTVTPTSGSLAITSGLTARLEKTGTDTWILHNGSTGGGGGTWGSITGTLSAQTDLDTALDAKEPTLTSTSASTAGGTITLDMNSLTQRMFVGSASFASGKIMALSNSTNALVFNFHFEVTTVAAALTLPGTWLMRDANFTSNIWTPTEIGKYEMGGSYDGTNWKVKIMGPFA